MYIPTTSSQSFEAQTIHHLARDAVTYLSYAALTHSHQDKTPSGGNSNDKIERWSSLIGVVTAICGNILISFALNTQRYAHMRLSRDREEREEVEKRKRGSKVGNAVGNGMNGVNGGGYGTTTSEAREQEVVAERRAKVNRKGEDEDGEEYSLLENGDEERTPLIPKLKSRTATEVEGGQEDCDEDSEGGVKEKSYLRSPIWWVGITMMTIGEAGNFLAYGFAPASLVSPLGVVALISNCLIAPLLLHERFRWRDALGVVIAVFGCVTVVLSASASNPKLTQDKIWKLITQWEFETYLGITVFLIVVLAVLSNRMGEKTVLIDLGLVALFGGYTALSTKGVASLFSNTIWRVVTFPLTYLLVAVLVFTAVMQIKYLNRALQRFNATVVIPTQFVLFTISVIVGSAVLYRDFERTTTQDAAEFIGGCALTFSGVWCITSGRGNESEDGDEEASDGPDGEGIRMVDEERTQPEVREMTDDDGRRPSYLSSSSANGAPPFKRSHTTDLVPPIEPLVNTSILDLQKDIVVEETLTNPQQHLIPAKAAAIRPASSIEEIQDDRASNQPPQIHTTISAPIIPTFKTTRPVTPPTRRSFAEPTTPTPRAGLATTTENLEPPGSTHRLVNRNSMAGLIPAPFTSPLSNSLSAIVADSLRRGVDHVPLASIRRRLNRSHSSRASNSRPDATGNGTHYPSALDAARPKRHSIASGDMPFEEISNLRQGGAEAGGSLRSGSFSGRMRSLSATFSDIFGPSRRARNNTLDREALEERRDEEQRGG